MFHSKSTPEDLGKVLERFSASNETKHRLWETKKMTAPVVDPVHTVQKAIESVAQLDPNDLAAAESHPTVLKLFGDAVIPKGNKAKS